MNFHRCLVTACRYITPLTEMARDITDEGCSRHASNCFLGTSLHKVKPVLLYQLRSIAMQ